MAILKGLKTIKQHDEEVERKRAERERKTNWFALKNEGDKAEVVFLQELDESSLRYSEKNGLGFLVQEHSNPSKTEFYKRIMCTNDEEHDHKCWGCEKNRQEWSKSTDENKYNGGWGAKTNLYINALVLEENDEGEEEWVVKVIQRKRSDNTFVEDLIDLAGEEGFISNRRVVISRRGKGFKTKYSMTVKDEDAGINVEDYDLYDLDALVREVEYEKQAAALGAGVAAPVERSEGSTDVEPEDDEGEDWL